MNYTIPPSFDDLSVIANGVIDTLPEEFLDYFEDIAIVVEDVADEAMEQELGLDDPFDLLVHFRKGSELSPGVQSKKEEGDDTLALYRRPILDLWCEEGEDLTLFIRQLMIEELGRAFEFSDDDIDDMVQRHDQIML